MSAFTLYDSTTQTPSDLTAALLTSASGITIDTSSINLQFGIGTDFGAFDPVTLEFTTTETPSISFYDGSITSLGGVNN